MPLGASALFLLATAALAAAEKAQKKTFEFAVVGVPLSPLHSVVVIGQELCLRGHNVTVVSFDERGKKKTEKYSPVCKLNYVSLGPMPLSEEAEQATMARLAKFTNSSVTFMKEAAKNIFSVWFDALKEPFGRIMADGVIKPDFALVSLPFGVVGEVLEQHGVDFAINMPTVLLPPISPYVASYIPIPFFNVGLWNMTIFDRTLVTASNYAVHAVKHAASFLGFKFSFMPDFNPTASWGRLVIVNSIPGFDYPQPLPPLVQYVGPVMDLKKMEPFPPEVEAFLDETPEGMPVVYVSFGTVFFLSPERVAAMVNTLTSDRYRVLWALPKAQQAGLPKNVPKSIMVHHWVPTPRALAHPKVAAFVSHCGGNSAAEAMAAGVPVVGYPQFGDQPAVCQRIADAGAGRTRPPGCWVQASDVREVISNPSFAAKAQRLSRLFGKFGGVGKAADMLELGARGDLEAMVLPTERSWTAWFQLGGYETLAVALVFAHLSALAAVACCRSCCRLCRSGRPHKNGLEQGKKRQ